MGPTWAQHGVQEKRQDRSQGPRNLAPRGSEARIAVRSQPGPEMNPKMDPRWTKMHPKTYPGDEFWAMPYIRKFLNFELSGFAISCWTQFQIPRDFLCRFHNISPQKMLWGRCWDHAEQISTFQMLHPIGNPTIGEFRMPVIEASTLATQYKLVLLGLQPYSLLCGLPIAN